MGVVQFTVPNAIVGLPGDDSEGASSGMVRDVFVSHAFKDKQIAEAICSILESSNLRCWMTARDVRGGEDWNRCIQKAISTARAFVLVLSENTNAADHIERELASAFHSGQFILPLRIGGVLPRRNLLFYLSDCCWFESADPPAVETLEAFAFHLKSRLPKAGSGVAGSPLPQQSGEPARPVPTRAGPGDGKKSHNRGRNILGGVIVSGLVAGALFLLAQEWRSAVDGGPVEFTGMPRTKKSISGTDRRTPEASTSPSPSYVFTRFGLWEPATERPAPEGTAGSVSPGAPEAVLTNATVPSNTDSATVPTEVGTTMDQRASPKLVTQPDNRLESNQVRPKGKHRRRHRTAGQRERGNPFRKAFRAFEAMIRGS